MSDEHNPIVGRLHFPRPAWRVVRLQWQGPKGWEGLESELRKRNRDYDLAFVTQAGDLYTLFLRLKSDTGTERRNGGRERMFREKSHGKTEDPER